MAWVKFLEDRQVLNGSGKVIKSFGKGDVVELPEPSARYWLNRRAAERCEAPAVAAAAAEAVEVEELQGEIAETRVVLGEIHSLSGTSEPEAVAEEAEEKKPVKARGVRASTRGRFRRSR